MTTNIPKAMPTLSSETKLGQKAERAIMELTKSIQETESWIDRMHPQYSGDDDYTYIPFQRLVELIISSMNTTKILCGADSVFYLKMEKLLNRHQQNELYMAQALEYGLREFSGILSAVKSAIISGAYIAESNEKSTYEIIDEILKHFYLSARYLSDRKRDQKKPLSYSIVDEYDVQDLLYSILKPFIKDLDMEDPVPKVAGDSGRLDIRSKDHGFIIETKYCRDLSHAQKMGAECRERIMKYSQPWLQKLYFIIYDPKNHILDPYPLESDLSKRIRIEETEFEVRLIVSPPSARNGR